MSCIPSCRLRGLCLTGPEGVGKTSLVHSLSSALGRGCAQVKNGELVDAAALLGDPKRRPGRVLEELRRVGASNPLLLFDELDRLTDRGGLPGSVLELFDSDQRAGFRDRYLELPFDLSEVLFVATATRRRPVPSMLREWLKVVDVQGYTPQDKRVIAAEHLLPAAIRMNGLAPDHVVSAVCARHVVPEGGALPDRGGESKAVVTPETVAEALGAPTFVEADVADRVRRPGVTVALGWTPYGGDVLFIEVGRMPGAGGLTLTGSLGRRDEGVGQGARLVGPGQRRGYGIDAANFRDTDLHVHAQPAAEQKDEASAGVALVAALVSSFTRRPVRADLAMTSEITLSGHVPG